MSDPPFYQQLISLLESPSMRFMVASLIALSILFLLFWRDILLWVENRLAEVCIIPFDTAQRLPTAPVRVLSDEWVLPDESILADEKEQESVWERGTQTQDSPAWKSRKRRIEPLCAIDHVLTNQPIDYSFFFEYQVDADAAKKALSVVLARVPVLGGHLVEMPSGRLAIDFTRPRVQFTHAFSEKVPSIRDEDFDKPHWYMRFTNGANHRFPFPERTALFKATLVHYLPPDAESSEETHSLLAIGCLHALTDGEGFFTVLRCWAAELRGEKWTAPTFSRKPLLLKKGEYKELPPDEIVLNKHAGNMREPVPWFLNTVHCPRRWKPRTILFSPSEIAGLKKKALSGKRGEELGKMRLSTNDIITALFWKIRATLNSEYAMEEPIMCTMVINTRLWLPERFPDVKETPFFGNALAFLVLHASRRELIDWDFSEVCFAVRTAVKSLRTEQFERDLHLYEPIAALGARCLHWYYGRWSVDGKRYGQSRGTWLYDRDMMISNLQKLPSLTFDMGQGHPCRVRFNFLEDGAHLSYFFRVDKEGKQCEFYGSIPEEDHRFYDAVDVKDPMLDWTQVNKEWVKCRPKPLRNVWRRRMPKVSFGALFDGREDTSFWRW